MKLDIALTKSSLEAVIYALTLERPAVDLAFTEIHDKVYFYICADVIKKLRKKEIDTADDFTNKPFKISLKYQEAAALWNELGKIQTFSTYRHACCFNLCLKIHEKLH